jgi:hypothetical protein
MHILFTVCAVLHPYYKLNYIKMAWGGEQEQQAEIAVGNVDAKNWQKEAQCIIEAAVHVKYTSHSMTNVSIQMELYHNCDMAAHVPSPNMTMDTNDIDGPDDYDCHRRQLLTQALVNEGWCSELSRYLHDILEDVTKDTDIVSWWGVHACSSALVPIINSSQVHAKIYLTLTKIALDVLPAQVSSVPCERLFSAGKAIADDRRSRLGADRFEQLQMLKFEWKDSLTDLAAWNSEQVEEVDMDEFTAMLKTDVTLAEWESATEMPVSK